MLLNKLCRAKRGDTPT